MPVLCLYSHNCQHFPRQPELQNYYLTNTSNTGLTNKNPKKIVKNIVIECNQNIVNNNNTAYCETPAQYCHYEDVHCQGFNQITRTNSKQKIFKPLFNSF